MQGCTRKLLWINIMTEVPAHVICEEKGTEGIYIRKEKIKLSLFLDNRIICAENSKETTEHLLEENKWGTSLVVQWVRLHTPNAGGPGSIPGWGTRSHMHATTKKPTCRKENPTCCN